MSEAVDHPSHYAKGEIECIVALQSALTPEEFAGLCKGSILQYVWREKGKGGIQDLQKARWYLDYLIKSRGDK